MVIHKLPDQSVLLNLFRYEPETGKLFWRPRSMSSFKSEAAAKQFHSCYEGKESGHYKKEGYIEVGINGILIGAHRIIWKMEYGIEPNNIDHINGDTTDNRISNLRDVVHMENCRNQKIRKTNTSGVMGVHFCRTSHRWSAQASDPNGKRVLVGRFLTFDEAVEARKIAERRFGYHRNHGRD